MSEQDLWFCRMLWRQIKPDVIKAFGEHVVKAASVGRLSDHFGKRRFEFYVPPCMPITGGARIECFASNAWDARYKCWAFLMMQLGGADEDGRVMRDIYVVDIPKPKETKDDGQAIR